MTSSEFKQRIEQEGFTIEQLQNAFGVPSWYVRWLMYDLYTTRMPIWAIAGLGYMVMNVILGNPPERGVSKLLNDRQGG